MYFVFWHRFPLIFATTLSVTPPLLCTPIHNTCTVNIWPPLSRCRWRWRGSAPGFPSPRSWRWRTTRTSWWVGHVLLITMLLIITAGGAARGGPHPPPLPPWLGWGGGALQLWRRPLLPRPCQVSRCSPSNVTRIKEGFLNLDKQENYTYWSQRNLTLFRTQEYLNV